MSPYADTNFYTRIYLELPESAQADRLLVSALEAEAPPLPLTWLLHVEIINAKANRLAKLEGLRTPVRIRTAAEPRH